jgi:hypothetical protein
MTREQAKKAIFDTKGKIFNVKFIKKDGTLRSMTCRRGVSKDVKGVGMSYDPQKFNLIGVYDMQKGFRMINASTIQEVTINGKTHEVAE